MRETIKIPFGSYYKEKFSKPIRNKKDIVLFIFDAVDALLVRVSGEECGVLWIKKEKMSIKKTRESKACCENQYKRGKITGGKKTNK